MNVSKFFSSNHSSAANIVIPFNTTLAGINVPRRRFLPVKTCSDLLIIMSNLYEMKHGQLEMSHLRQFPTVPIVQLSGSHFKKVRGHSSRCLMFNLVPRACVILIQRNVQRTIGVILGADQKDRSLWERDC